MHLPLLRGEQHIVLVGADLHPDDAVARLELHRDLAVAVDAGEVGKLVAAHVARLGGEHDVELFPLRLVFRQRQDGRDLLAFRQRQKIDHRLALALDARFGQAPDFELVGHAGRGKEHERRMRRRHEDEVDEIFLARRHARAAFAAAALHAIFVERRALDVAGMGHRDGDVFALDQRLVLDLDFGIDEFGHARRREFGADFLELGCGRSAARAAANAGCRDSP